MQRSLLALVAATALIGLDASPSTASAAAAGLLSSTANLPHARYVIAVNHWRYNYWCCGASYYAPPAYGYYYPPPAYYYPPPVVYYAPPVPRYYAPPVDYYGDDDGYVVRHRRVRYYDGDW